MQTITVEFPEPQVAAIALAAAAEQVSPSDVVRRSVTEYLQRHVTPPLTSSAHSIHERLKKYIPASGAGIPDLSSNPKHLEDFGAD